jgi:hypothetical protein
MTTYVLMPFGDTGRDLTEAEAIELTRSGQITLCGQCSTGTRKVYH